MLTDNNHVSQNSKVYKSVNIQKIRIRLLRLNLNLNWTEPKSQDCNLNSDIRISGYQPWETKIILFLYVVYIYVFLYVVYINIFNVFVGKRRPN